MVVFLAAGSWMSLRGKALAWPSLWIGCIWRPKLFKQFDSVKVKCSSAHYPIERLRAIHSVKAQDDKSHCFSYCEDCSLLMFMGGKNLLQRCDTKGED